MTGIYRICLKGRLDGRWAEWFDGLTLTGQEDGTTTLVGHVADQAALHGILAKARDLGLPVLALYMIESGDDDLQEK